MIIGVLLAGAQILVSMINMTGIGVTLSSLIVAVAGNSLFLVALIVAGVCLVMGMGIPTTAAYVLVAAVLAPALVAAGVEPLVAHMFVFYFATISVITPPVCVAVFVASGIAQTNWMPVAVEAVRLAAVTYMIPFMFFLYPGMLGFGGAMQIAEAAVSGLILVVATSCLLGGMRIFARRVLDTAFFVAVGALAILPWWIGPILAGVMLVLAFGMGRRPVPWRPGADDGSGRQEHGHEHIGHRDPPCRRRQDRHRRGELDGAVPGLRPRRGGDRPGARRRRPPGGRGRGHPAGAGPAGPARTGPADLPGRAGGGGAGRGLRQENAPERLDLKIDLLARLDRAAPKGALIASSTSSLLRSRMVRDCADPGRVVIAHPFNPPHLVPLVELVGEPDACRRAAEFYAAIGKRPVILNREATGHIANRLTAALWREALYIVEQGIADVEDVDAAITAGPGLRWAVMGPFMTYHLGGGAGGIAHYLDHLGPSQMHRWNDLGTPTVDEDLKRQVVGGVDREAAGRTIGQLEQERDRALLAILGTRAPDGS